MGAKRVSDVEVEIGNNLRTVIGEQNGTLSKRVESIRSLLNEAGFEAETSLSMTKLTWDKMVMIVAQQALSALTGKTFGELRRSSTATNVVTSLLEELRAVAAQQGIVWNDDLLARVHANWDSLPNHRSSMWQDLQNGRRTEIDFINGAIVRLGTEGGIATPWNQVITSMIQIAEENAAGGEHQAPG